MLAHAPLPKCAYWMDRECDQLKYLFANLKYKPFTIILAQENIPLYGMNTNPLYYLMILLLRPLFMEL